jgi:hypothetical protein
MPNLLVKKQNMIYIKGRVNYIRKLKYVKN